MSAGASSDAPVPFRPDSAPPGLLGAWVCGLATGFAIGFAVGFAVWGRCGWCRAVLGDLMKCVLRRATGGLIVRTIQRVLAATALQLVTFAGVAAPLACAPEASAQMRFGPGGPGGSEISKSGVESYAKVLKLDSAQKDAAMQLFEAYRSTVEAARKEMSDAMKAVREEGQDDASVFMEKMPKIAEAHGKKRQAAQTQFLSDLKSLLSSDQEQQWPALERMRRREGSLRGGMVSGSNVDIVALVNSMNFPPDQHAKLADTLQQYELDMDRVLQEQEKSAAARAPKPGPDGQRTFVFEGGDKLKEMMDAQRAESLKIRELNQNFARRLAALLPEDQAARLNKQFKTQAFKRVYGEAQPTRWLAAAEKFDDLDAGQREKLKALRESYEREAASLNDKWAAVLEQAETDGTAGGGMMFGPGARKENDELKAARKARQDLDKKTNEQIKTALNDKQKERLPKRSQQEGEGGVFLAGGEGFFVTAEESSEGDDGEVRQSIQVIGVGGGGF